MPSNDTTDPTATISPGNDTGKESPGNCAVPRGFRFATARAGFRKPDRNDLALVVSDTPAVAAAVFTRNLFQAAPVLVARDILARTSRVRAVLINAGQANACTGDEGLANCRATLEMVAAATGLAPQDILPASTGVIGAHLPMDKWAAAVPALATDLDKPGCTGPEDFARAIMTTDAFPKFASRAVELSGGTVTLAGMAKGAGMICPDMATLLATVVCDADVEPAAWQALFRGAVDATFNRVTVDGDTSTNDTVFGLANGASGVSAHGTDLTLLGAALTGVLDDMAYMLVKDGEGATKVIHINVAGARDDADAELAARTVGHSPLVKTAMYGRDANWGRIVMALGRSGATFDPAAVIVSLCGVELFRNGQPANTDFETLLKEPLAGRDIVINIMLGSGPGSYRLRASDLTHDYVSCNADYRS